MKNLQVSDDLATAIERDEKDVTRRLISTPKSALMHGRQPLPDRSFADECGFSGRPMLNFAYGGGDLGDDCVWDGVYPRYLPSDVVYHGEALTKDVLGFALYRRDGADVIEHGYDAKRWCWQRSVLPARFCPEDCARLFSEIVSVRAERLHAITEEDAKREGTKKLGVKLTHLMTFKRLWDSINEARAPWASNPWVWRIEFRRIESREVAVELHRERLAAGKRKGKVA